LTVIEQTAAVVDALNELQVPYMLTGSLASNTYGIVRSTQDADFVVQVDDAGVTRIAAQLTPLFKLDPQVSFETVTMSSRYVMLSSDQEFKVELFLLTDDPYDQERFRRRMKGVFEGRVAYLPAPEDVILFKMLWYKQARRRKDLDDVKNVIAVQGSRLDAEYLQHWCSKYGTLDLLNSIRGELTNRDNAEIP
jgi:hypothetical protein